MKKTFLTLIGISSLAVAAQAQTVITADDYTQNFNSIGSGLPTGWTVRTGATASSLGSVATFSTTQAGVADTSGGFKNFTSAGGSTSDRALGVRQTGSFGDGGAAFAFNFSTIDVEVTQLSIDLQMLSVQPRSTTWTIQYGIGASPTSWVTLGTYSDPGTVGSTTRTYTTANFGTALDDVSSAWFRVVALSASTGSGNRDSFGIDNFSIQAVATVPEPSTYAMLFAGVGVMVWVVRRKRSGTV